MDLTPINNYLLFNDFRFPQASFWCEGSELRKRKHAYVELPAIKMATETKNLLYDLEHSSSVRRRKKRK